MICAMRVGYSCEGVEGAQCGRGNADETQCRQRRDRADKQVVAGESRIVTGVEAKRTCRVVVVGQEPMGGKEDAEGEATTSSI